MSDIEDQNDSWWHQQEQDEQWLRHHRKVNDDYRIWLIEQGVLKPKRNENEIRSESNG